MLLVVDGEEALCLRQISGPLAKKLQPITKVALGVLLFLLSNFQ